MYRTPPKDTRFKPGHSGNPNWSPKETGRTRYDYNDSTNNKTLRGCKIQR